MNATLKRKLAVGTTILAGAALAGGAYAASTSSTNPRQAFLDDVAKRLNVTPQQLKNALEGAVADRLQQAVTAGKLTQAQADTIKRRLQGKEGKEFRYRDLGSMATISRFRAVVSFKGIRLSGFFGWLAWLFVHLTFLTGFKNRIAIIPRWAITFIGNSRPQRTITMQQVIGRVALERAGGRPFLMSLVEDDSQSTESEKPE